MGMLWRRGVTDDDVHTRKRYGIVVGKVCTPLSDIKDTRWVKSPHVFFFGLRAMLTVHKNAT